MERGSLMRRSELPAIDRVELSLSTENEALEAEIERLRAALKEALDFIEI